MEKEYLEKIVKESKSLSEVLIKLNKSISGVAIKLLKKDLDSLEISYTHLTKIKRNKKSYTIEEILNNEAPCQSSKLKNKLIKLKIKDDVCEMCGQTNSWHGKKLTLHLDHINGNHYDNSLENLRILCPNCHSQTETFGNKKRKHNLNYCQDCGAVISKQSTYCLECSYKHKKSKVLNKPSKDDLLEMIFLMPMSKIGEKYSVQESAVRKWCKKYNIPSNKKEMSDFLNNKK